LAADLMFVLGFFEFLMDFGMISFAFYNSKTAIID